MADVMEERVRSILSYAGVGFALGAVVLSLALALFPALPPANQANLVIETMAKEGLAGWMGLHAAMVLGFLASAVGFTAFAFLLHLRGSSGPASVVTVCALVGASIYVSFLSMEFFLPTFIRNLYPIDPGLATMVFSTVWFWKMGALAVGSVLLFAAVVAAGLSGSSRDVIPVWLGWGGAVFGAIGILVYLFDFWSSTVTGAAINPMRMTAVRYGVGLPLQIWMLAVGALLLRERSAHAHAVPPQARTPVPRRDPARPARTGTPFADAPRGGQEMGGGPRELGGGQDAVRPAASARVSDGPLSPRERAAATGGANLEPQLPPGTPEPPPLPPPIP
ncbi:MAG TPA: hypothetical protein VFX78_09095 [Candidatus Eisenbacteria bacterium]|jgi:hypothetical protein|nr:hypothetical protein [Candidatus Eisenbacteria bacterium]